MKYISLEKEAMKPKDIAHDPDDILRLETKMIDNSFAINFNNITNLYSNFVTWQMDILFNNKNVTKSFSNLDDLKYPVIGVQRKHVIYVFKNYHEYYHKLLSYYNLKFIDRLKTNSLSLNLEAFLSIKKKLNNRIKSFHWYYNMKF